MRSPTRCFWLAVLAAIGAAWVLAEPRPGAARSGTLHGRVMGPGGPLVGARVRFKGSADLTLTDERGRFTLPAGQPGSTVTAAAEGFLIGGVPAGLVPLELRLKPLSSRDWPGYQWVDPTPDTLQAKNCGNCHADIHDEWQASGHAAAATNRRFLNLYDGSDWQGHGPRGWNMLAEHPDGAAVCASCHAPTIDEASAAFDDIRQVSGVAAHGVHCDLCHKIRDVPAAHLGLAHGRFGLELLRPAEGQVFFGPLDDVDRGEDAYSPLMGQSRYCASCHEGIVFGVHVYSTYSEWLDSPARLQGRQCQDCHMTPTGRMTNVAGGAGGIERPAHTLASHGMFPGGRRAMLDSALTLAVDAARQASRVNVSVELTAHDVGHCVPTGYIDRHLVLVLEGFERGGRRVEPLSGPQLPPAAGADASGLAGRLFGRLLTDPEGNAPAPFWRAGCTLADTRLRPGLPDRGQYTFPLELDTIRLRLIYRRFWPEVARGKGWPSDEILVREQVIRPAP